MAGLVFAFGLMPAAFGLNLVTNGSFEPDSVPAYPGYTNVFTGWTSSGSALRNDSTGPFYVSGSNGAIPNGAQVAGIQGAGSLSQNLSGMVHGACYTLSFYTCKRAATGNMDLVVTLGNHTLYGVTTISYAAFTNIVVPFTYSSSWGSTLTLTTQNPVGDATILFDYVQVLNRQVPFPSAVTTTATGTTPLSLTLNLVSGTNMLLVLTCGAISNNSVLPGVPTVSKTSGSITPTWSAAGDSQLNAGTYRERISQFYAYIGTLNTAPSLTISIAWSGSIAQSEATCTVYSGVDSSTQYTGLGTNAANTTLPTTIQVQLGTPLTVNQFGVDSYYYWNKGTLSANPSILVSTPNNPVFSASGYIYSGLSNSKTFGYNNSQAGNFGWVIRACVYNLKTTAPAISSISASPQYITTGATTTITFHSTDLLTSNTSWPMSVGASPSTPTVTIVGLTNATYSTSSFTTAPDVTYQYTYTSTGSEAEGWKNVSIVGTDYVGNGATDGSASNVFIVDRTPPGVPVFTGIETDTGTSSSDFKTTDDTLVFNGTAEANASVELQYGVASGGPYFPFTTVSANGSGAWTLDYTPYPIAADTYYLIFQATDAATNKSAWSSETAVVIDQSAPTPCTVSINGGAAYATSTSVTLTLDATDSDSGMGTGKMQFSNDNSTWLPASPATYATSYSWTLSTGDGTKTVYAKFTDEAGNTTTATISDTIVLDTVLPPAPVMLSIEDDTGVSSSDVITTDQTLIYHGTCAEPGASIEVRVYLDTLPWGPLVPLGVVVDGSNNWTFDNTAGVADEGTWHLEWAAKDPAGNYSDYSTDYSLVIDRTAPTVSSVAVQSGLTVDVTFNEPMGTGVTTASNYTVSGSGKGSLAGNPNSVALVSGNKYRLTWSAGEMVNGGDITVTVGSGAQDVAGNGVGSPNSGTHTGGGIGVAPTVTNRDPAPSATIITASGANVDVTFSETVQGVDATDMAIGGAAAAGASVGAPTDRGGLTWRFPIAGLAAGTLTISLAPDANDIEDLAGNDLANLGWSYTIVMEVLSVTVSPDQWAIGAQALSYVGESATYTAANDGNVAEDFSVKASDGANGWTLENAVGTDKFKVEADNGDNGSYETVLTTGEQALASDVAVSGSVDVGFRYSAPSGDTQGAETAQDFSITITATRHLP